MKIFNNEKGLNIVGQGGKIILFTLPFLFAIIIVHLFFPSIAYLPDKIIFIKPVGYLFLIFGIFLWLTGVIQLLIEFPKGKLITTGAYGVVRNPIYSSFCFLNLPAITLLAFTWVYLVVSLALFIGVKIFIKKEEEQLKEVFGKNYENYFLEIDRMIPFNIFRAINYNKEVISKYLLTFGILSTVLYISSDFICSYSYKGYSFFDQTMSELSAIGAPTTSLWKMLTVLHAPFVLLFGVGVLLRTGKKLSLKISGILLLVYGLSLYVWLFFPMNMRENIGETSDSGHLVLAGITVFLLIAIITTGSSVRGNIFKIYSFITLGLMMFFGFLSGTMTASVAANEPTPWMGIYERISIYSSMIWISVYGLMLLKIFNEKKQLG
jgi:protein-S-isoprenylcysteine O-methyltransferase Ste14